MGEVPWIEISLVVTAEQAEAVAEILGRFTREGVVIEQLADQTYRGEGILLQPNVKVYGYLFADDSLGERRKRLEEALWYLGRIQPLPRSEYKPLPDEDWLEAWKRNYHPIQIGKNLAVIPAWVEQKFPGKLPIYIHPGLAFGTGTHPTTQLCLEYLESLVPPSMQVFDIGCGSGILSIAAARLGAKKVVAVDIDPASVRSTLENSQLNGVEKLVAIGQGSIALIQSGYFGETQAPIVVANILASVIITLLDLGMAQLVEHGGSLLLSGILEEQVEEVTHKASEYGLVQSGIRKMEDWAAVLFRSQ